ncbi:ankyrin repeat domain-containing protein 60 [Vulpes lagopus]|uniref:ankyrin repeat domain-containing protein 60 n=1 Tax=Vulpes lagopus TaxID=494514 RepID=UPI001BC9C400|nr:ankyrin repeat domain-containing protein 60 [Vulpes lagopus]
MRRAAAGGGARAGAPPGGALGPDPGRGGRGAGSAGPRPLPAQSAARAPGQGGVAAPQAPSPALDLAPDTFVMRVLLEDTGETFQVANCRGDMTVRELKEELDLLVGIPLDLQRLQYLDQGVLMDDATLKFHDVVPGGIISLCIWHYDGWTELVLAAVEGDPSKLSCLGVDEDSLYRTANSQRFERKQCQDWIARRAFVALYVTSHRGHPDAVQYLLEHGANCLSKTPMGRTALHVAAAMGRLDCINHLLDYGASIHEKDARGETPMSIARRMNRKLSERRMFLFYWMSRLGTKDPKNLIKNQRFPSISVMRVVCCFLITRFQVSVDSRACEHGGRSEDTCRRRHTPGHPYGTSRRRPVTPVLGAAVWELHPAALQLGALATRSSVSQGQVLRSYPQRARARSLPGYFSIEDTILI